MRLFRRTGSTGTRWAIAFGIAAVVVAVVIGLNPWGSGPRDLYAAAVAQLQEARSLRFTHYSDMNPPGFGEVLVEYKEPAHLRLTVRPGWYLIIDHDQGKGIWIYTDQKMYDEIDDFGGGDEARRIIDDLRSLPDQADEVLERREMDGRTVQGFRVNETQVGMKNVAVWVDLKTGDPVRVEGEQEIGVPNNASSLTMYTVRNVLSNFDFNVELDDSLFDTAPPEGYTVGPLTRSRVDPDEVEGLKKE